MTAAFLTAPTLPAFTREDLPFMSGPDFTKHVAAVNQTYLAARTAYDDACQALGDLLTEQIARHIRATFTGAWRLTASPATIATEEGEQPRLLPSAVTGRDGTVLGYVDRLSPVAYMLERLTPHLGAVHCELDISARTWEFPYGRWPSA